MREVDRETRVHKTSTRPDDDPRFFKLFVNEYIYEDPTLSKTSRIPCPSPKCDAVETIPLRYNASNMSYVYTCAKCKYTWRPSNESTV